MGRNPKFWSEEKRRVRATVDAVREVLGFEPLYNQPRVPQEAWLSDVRDAYYETKPARAGQRGCKL